MVFVSVGGLTINLVGLIFFSEDAQSSENIKGLFLHVLADTLGSLGVLLSCFLVKQFDMHRSDPVCALFVSLTIFVSVIPLLKSSSLSLLGQVP
jgi:solute carrier family 30 (zinc transporter), member 5/7